MSGFAALMALSASQTRESQSAVQSALQQRQRNEEIRRKKQEDADRKRREEEAKLRQKRFEDEKKERELEAKREAEMKRMEAEQRRREEEARNALLYGPKKKHGPKWPSSNGSAREEPLRRRFPSDEDDSRSGSPAISLTREEKRQRKFDAEMRRTYSVKRSSGFSGYSKAGRRLPGGAIDTTASPASDSGSGTQSVKARLAALPNTLTKLNVNKRDTRTIDEILQDRAKARENVVLDGDEAREFHDWFGKSKKKDSSQTSTQSSTTLPSAPSSGGNSPMPSSAKTNSQSAAKMAYSTKSSAQPSAVNPQVKTLAGTKVSSSSTKGTADFRRPSTTPKATHSRSPAPPPKSQPSKASLGQRPAATVPSKKRPRSPSLSLSPPPPKRRGMSPEDSFRSEIWKLFGKDRTSYVARDVLSDDEDMEADASAVMKEELRSARLAKHEDDLAFEEERRREEEKRRRKREREMKEKRG